MSPTLHDPRSFLLSFSFGLKTSSFDPDLSSRRDVDISSQKIMPIVQIAISELSFELTHLFRLEWRLPAFVRTVSITLKLLRLSCMQRHVSGPMHGSWYVSCSSLFRKDVSPWRVKSSGVSQSKIVETDPAGMTCDSNNLFPAGFYPWRVELSGFNKSEIIELVLPGKNEGWNSLGLSGY